MVFQNRCSPQIPQTLNSEADSPTAHGPLYVFCIESSGSTPLIPSRNINTSTLQVALKKCILTLYKLSLVFV